MRGWFVLFSIALIGAGFLGGCATTGDLDEIRMRDYYLDDKVDGALKAARSARAAAHEAQEISAANLGKMVDAAARASDAAARAEIAALIAQERARAVSERQAMTDRKSKKVKFLFNKSMKK